jgi:RNA polymerase sigma factor (sigma-70 family)
VLDEALLVSQDPRADLVGLHEALERLEALDPRKGRVVELRFFGGLNLEETAVALNVSSETVQRDWRVAKDWLRRELQSEDADGG